MASVACIGECMVELRQAQGGASSGQVAGQGGGLWPVTYQAGQAILLDPAGALYAAIGSGNWPRSGTAPI